MDHVEVCMKKKGSSRWTLFGGLNHYDKNGKKTGHSDRGLFGDWKDYSK